MPLSGGFLFYGYGWETESTYDAGVNALIGRLPFLHGVIVSLEAQKGLCQCPYRAASFSTLVSNE